MIFKSSNGDLFAVNPANVVTAAARGDEVFIRTPDGSVNSTRMHGEQEAEAVVKWISEQVTK